VARARQAVQPIRWDAVAATIFTTPEVATVGWSPAEAESAGFPVETARLDFRSNPRAKMIHGLDGFVKVHAMVGSGTVLGGVVVSTRASDLIQPLAVAVQNRLSVAQLAQTMTVYPSMAGSVDRMRADADDPPGPATPLSGGPVPDVELYFDPVCPFCWQTSKWLRQVQRLTGLEVGYRFISLLFVNEPRGYDGMPAGYREVHEQGTRLLRVAAATREAHGNEAVGALYEQLGEALFEVDAPAPGGFEGILAHHLAGPTAGRAAGGGTAGGARGATTSHASTS
jgi:hypothetical protein